MEKRQITMGDGRYLILYTFAEETAPPPSPPPGAPLEESQEGSASGQGTTAKPEAEEERRV
jgi:hypothetical protein